MKPFGTQLTTLSPATLRPTQAARSSALRSASVCIPTAGELATEFGIAAELRGTATAAAADAFKKWVEVRGGDGKEPAEDRAAIRQVTELIVRYGESRFDELDEHGFKVVFGRADEGSSPPLARAALIRLGWRKGHGDNRIWMIVYPVWENEFGRGFDPVRRSSSGLALGES